MNSFLTGKLVVRSVGDGEGSTPFHKRTIKLFRTLQLVFKNVENHKGNGRNSQRLSKLSWAGGSSPIKRDLHFPLIIFNDLYNKPYTVSIIIKRCYKITERPSLRVNLKI